MTPEMTVNAARRILLGLTGGIAAYKSAQLVRLLVKSGYEVRVVMTESACRFITPVTLQALSGQTVWTDLWDPRIPDNMGHIELSRDRELIVVAPASANFMAKVAHGEADDLLTTLCLARDCPLMVAPAMNRQMWDNAATQRNAAQLRSDGVIIAGPEAGDQACGETGMGRMLEPEAVFEEIEAFFQPKVLAGKRVLVTAGPTSEPIDPVRTITNSSSGKMGYAVARAAREAGAQVTLISGPTALATPAGVARIDVQSAQQMFDSVRKAVVQADIFVAVAAVADYKVANPSDQKIKKGNGQGMSIDLAENPDILAHVAKLPNGPFCVGFAAETENLAKNAAEKRARKKIPLLAANLAQSALGADDNEITLFDDAGEHALGRGSKLDQARKLIGHVAAMLPKGKHSA
jgi:phosphopantothenoylcysteine decarboxylase / phosphopantothenate---cysteine ligase